ncbi:glycosyltransferase family 2 protein [Croceicoccus marinus]|uniref:Glycosyl transferase n=1 Tax=Croceicoccus marinus TaxID=450378 RepID=A0A1Z1FG64_9SPHN|nr:galactosyltransferase-related protein [Croceicoccus marinus]ARU17798.1 glycosyl transferase [Croceicoccus marinus]QNE07300.1 glycosyltransferase [Croceicoccus marinus]
MISVCTLAHGREGHLRNLVRGLNESRMPPGELVVAVLQDQPYDLPETAFPVRQIMLQDGGLSLSAARNRAAAEAAGEWLVFLDVDCIPHPELVGDYAAALQDSDALLMGEVGYLPSGAPLETLDFAVLDRLAVRHSERPGPPVGPIAPCRDYRCFWSLNFAMSAALFRAVGGFDEGYRGYGGEDTDFGRTCAEQGVPLFWLRGARAYHQYHPHHMPPVHHLDSVIRNAEYFRSKWGEPTMQHWLRAFRLMGLAEPGPSGWQRIRPTQEADLALTRQQQHQPYASSAAVLQQLEAEAEVGTRTDLADTAAV